MGYRLKPEWLKYPKDERILSISINKNDEVQFIITSTNSFLGRFRLYELINSEFVLLWKARTTEELVERLYLEKGFRLVK